MILWRWLIFLGALMWCGLCLVDIYAHKIIRCHPKLEFTELASNIIVEPFFVKKESAFKDVTLSEESISTNKKRTNQNKYTEHNFYSNILILSAIFGCYGLVDFIRLRFNGFNVINGIINDVRKKISEVLYEKVQQLKYRYFGCKTMVVATGSLMGQLEEYNDTFVASHHMQIQENKGTDIDHIFEIPCIEVSSSMNRASVGSLDSSINSLNPQTEIESMSLEISKITVKRTIDSTEGNSESIFSVTTIKKDLNLKMISSESALQDILRVYNLSPIDEGYNNPPLDSKALKGAERVHSKYHKKSTIPQRNSNVIEIKDQKDDVYDVKEVLPIPEPKLMKSDSSKSAEGGCGLGNSGAVLYSRFSSGVTSSGIRSPFSCQSQGFGPNRERRVVRCL